MKKKNNFSFIDSNNLHLAVKGLGWDLDYGKFRRYLTDKYSVTKAYIQGELWRRIGFASYDWL